MTTPWLAHALSDHQLLERVRQLAARERTATAQLVAHLAEVDSRRLFLGQGYSSMFTYCTQALRLSEHAAYSRIEAARLVRRCPDVLPLLEGGRLTLTTVCLLAPVLTGNNAAKLLARATHKTKREVELLVAECHPRPDVATMVRKIPAPSPRPKSAGSLPAESAASAPVEAARPVAYPPTSKPAAVAPLSPERFRLQVTITREAHDALRRVQALARHSVPSGDPAILIEKAIRLLLEHLERQQCGSVRRARTTTTTAATHSRHVPAAIRRAVWARDAHQCAFVGADGRCQERAFLEVHHVVPFADGGATSVENLQLRCRAHNAYEATEWFGPLFARESPGVWTRSGPS
jgi:5-methylcytosine-specific restriction endonuclease McrA